MSALRIEPLKKRAEYQFCVNGCQGVNGTRAAKFRVTMVGYSVGLFCPACSKELRAIWDGALDTEELAA